MVAFPGERHAAAQRKRERGCVRGSNRTPVTNLRAIEYIKRILAPEHGHPWFQPLINRWFALSTFAVGSFMLVISYLTGGTYYLFILSIIVPSLAGYLLARAGRHSLSAYLLIVSLTVAVMIRSSAIQSTMSASFLCIIIIVSAIITNQWFTMVIFLADMMFIIACTLSGTFTWYQPQDPVTGLYFANTVTVLVPFMIVSYIIALVVSRVLLGTIRAQTAQYDLLKKTQERLITQEKMESLRVLIGGIAHDFNNILMAVLGNISLLRFQAGESGGMRENIEEAEKALNRARKLTGQLLLASKGTSPVKTLTSLREVIVETAEFSTHGSRAVLSHRIGHDLWAVEADAAQIAQVVQNLIINAIQAMPEGGKVTVTASNVMIGEKDHLPLKRGPHVKITVSDRGPGVPHDLKVKIFDPFFTTKEQGTGLGLSICYSIVRNHGGHITVYSEEGKGAEFGVFLPAIPGAVPPTEETGRSSVPRSGRVLVMDDDPHVLRILRKMLEILGFTVESSSSGEEAVMRYKESLAGGELFDLVIMDLTVPGGMGGMEALGEIRAVDPHVRAVISSGYTDGMSRDEISAAGFIAVLSKPYTLEELSHMLEKVMEGSA